MSKDDDRQQRRERRKKVRAVIGWVVVLSIMGALAYVILAAPRLPASELEAAAGLHYHPRLTIFVNGEKMTIPNNIGIGVVHNPIHTHEEGDGTIHLEFEGSVRKEDIHLGRFFDVWGKEWTATSFMGLPVGDGHTLTMKVNGALSTEYRDLLMKDGQAIELSYQ
jgi:hypothetical protein